MTRFIRLFAGLVFVYNLQPLLGISHLRHQLVLKDYDDVKSTSNNIALIDTEQHVPQQTNMEIRPYWAKGHWPPIPPEFDEQGGIREGNWEYQLRTCNTFQEWEEFVRQETADRAALKQHVERDLNELAKLPQATQQLAENILKRETLEEIKTKIDKRLNKPITKAGKLTKLRARLASPWNAVKDHIMAGLTDPLKWQIRQLIGIQGEQAMDLIRTQSCNLIKKLESLEKAAAIAGAVCSITASLAFEYYIGYLPCTIGTVGLNTLVTGTAGAALATLGVDALEKGAACTTEAVICLIHQAIQVPENLLITEDEIEAQCKDRRKEAKRELKNQKKQEEIERKIEEREKEKKKTKAEKGSTISSLSFHCRRKQSSRHK